MANNVPPPDDDAWTLYVIAIEGIEVVADWGAGKGTNGKDIKWDCVCRWYVEVSLRPRLTGTKIHLY